MNKTVVLVVTTWVMYCLGDLKIPHKSYSLFAGVCEHVHVIFNKGTSFSCQWTAMWCNTLEDTLITSYFQGAVPLIYQALWTESKSDPEGSVASCQTISSISHSTCLFASRSCDVTVHHPVVAITACTQSWAIPFQPGTKSSYDMQF